MALCYYRGDPEPGRFKAAEGARFENALKAGIITPTTKEMLTQAEAERDRRRQALQMPTRKLDTLTSVLPNLVDRFQRMLDDLARATRYEIDKAQGILQGLVGDYAGLILLIFQGKIKLVAVTRIERVTRGL